MGKYIQIKKMSLAGKVAATSKANANKGPK